MPGRKQKRIVLKSNVYSNQCRFYIQIAHMGNTKAVLRIACDDGVLGFGFSPLHTIYGSLSS